VTIALIDCDDSYTLNIADGLRRCHAQVEVISHRQVSIEFLDSNSFDAIVLSPGPKKPQELTILNKIIADFEAKIPMLGICLGHQAIGLHYGCSIEKSAFPIHGVPVKIDFKDDPIFKSIDEPFYAMRYNSLTLRQHNENNLSIVCTDEYGDIMGLKHEIYPIYSFQFHPESIGTPQGIKLFENWISLVSNYKSSQMHS
jgi:anthranilate synthase/aminodeoxychorismate synthase-like glutamine amidotransferase